MIYIKWLLKNIEKKYRRWLVFGLVISAVTSVMQLIDPWLTSRLYDDVIMAQNPGPLIPILSVMLGVQIVRMGARYAMTRYRKKAHGKFREMRERMAEMNTTAQSRDAGLSV